MRDNMTNAHSNFETAMLQRRSSGEGRLLPSEAWAYCADLLEPEGSAYRLVLLELPVQSLYIVTS